MRHAALLAVVLLAIPGCIGTEDAETPQESDGGGQEQRAPSPAPAGQDETPASASVPPPSLPVGRTWTYRATQLYSPDPEVKIVVARADEKGYLFAGAAEDDLVHHALWGSEWHGEHGRDLMPPDAWYKSFSWPLSDGKTWEFAEGITVKATAAEIVTPNGRRPGFVIEGGNDRATVRYEYAPDVGYYVRYKQTWGDRVTEELELVRVEDNVTAWLWYELGPLAAATGPEKPGVLDVAAGWDAVLVSVGGVAGGRATIVPPSGSVWQTEFTATEETWQHAILPSAEGKWAATIQGRPWIDGAPPLPGGWAWMHYAPVRWLPAGAL